ncbi:unnamed protein product, partial [Notodromas monacha]
AADETLLSASHEGSSEEVLPSVSEETLSQVHADASGESQPVELPEVSGSSEEVPPVSTEEPQAAEGESHDEASAAVEPTTETSSSEIPVSESEEDKLSLVEGEPALSVENASGETEQLPEAVPETDPTISTEISQETSLESPASAETTPSPEEQPLVIEAEAPIEVIIDPGPQIGEPAYEYPIPSGSEQDIPRDRTLLDAFASAAPTSAFLAAAEKAIKELKSVYEKAVKPLETVYEYESISSRVFGDAEISAKPLILLMGPTGTGKTSAIKYLLGLDSASAIPRIPIGPVPAQSQFTIWRHAENPSVEMGPELAADATFTTLQKFGLSALDRVTGIRLKAPLLDKVDL